MATYTTGPKKNGAVSAVFILVLASLLLVVVLSYAILKLRPDAQRSMQTAAPVRVYCASGVAEPVEQVIRAYNRTFSAHIEIVRTGGSGELAGQIKTEFESGFVGGADLFVSADDQLMAKANSDGVIAERLDLASQKPVIVVSSKSPLVIDGLRALIFDRNIKYGIASERAAVGQLVRKIAERDGLAAELELNKTTELENVMTLAQAVVSGSLDAAIVWDTTVSQINRSSRNGDGPVLKIAAVADPLFEFQSNVVIGVVASTKNPTDCLRFSRYLSAPETGQPSFEKFGYSVVDGDRWEEVPEIHLYCGSMFTPVLERAVRAFATREGVNLYSRWEGCGKLVASMKSIEDSDLFPDAYLACDVMFLEDVKEQFETPTNISKNQIVMAVRRDLDREIREPADLLGTDLRIGICDPAQSALGRLTSQILGSVAEGGIYEQLAQQSAVTVDVGPTLMSQILAGGLDVVFVYRSNIMSSTGPRDGLEIIEITGPVRDSIAVQPWVISKSTQNAALMGRLFDWIRRDEITSRFEELGFDVIERSHHE